MSVWVAALWWGSLTTVGFYVVPMLFANLPSPAIAGNMAAKLFAVQTWIAVACGLLLLLVSRSNQPLAQVELAQAATVFIILGMLLALLGEFAVAPRIVARQNLPLWHSVGMALYIAQWVCAGLTFRKLQPKVA
ncbi:transmembrane domain protein [Rhodoferax antarcticus ANT.BR]|uniref:Transmembrane domain protein n=1 Tax=Rhodoferax antarcticus ANT.BR TaxID=1111071 RepID=A0A1Q8YBB6_9BURK|nr:transmembrane domain protein [Rhodoferax antarcticus ANT.BR]